MSETWWQALIYPLPLLAIPIAMLLGQRVRGGAVTIMSVGAALSAGFFWLSLRGTFAPWIYAFNWLLISIAALLAIGLLLCAWALALAEAFRERRWSWIVAQCLAVYLSFVALISFLMLPYPTCSFNPAPPICASFNPNVGTALLACTFVGPLALLAYALRIHRPRGAHALPDGLVVSHLDVE